MNYIKNIFPHLPSWLSSQRQNVFLTVAIAVAILAIVFIIIKNNKTKKHNPQNASFVPEFNNFSDNTIKSASQNSAFDAKFKVVEEILKTDSKNIIE